MNREAATSLYVLSGVIAVVGILQASVTLWSAADTRHALLTATAPQLPALPLPFPPASTDAGATVAAPEDQDVPASPVLHIGTDVLGRRALCLNGHAYDVPGDGATALVARMPVEPARRDKDGRAMPDLPLRCIEAGDPLPQRTQARPTGPTRRLAVLV